MRAIKKVHLHDGGRIVAIISEGTSSQKYLDNWLNGNENAETKAERDGEKGALLVKEISLPNVVFNRAGTSVKTKVVIIDKQMMQEGQDNTYQGSTTEFSNITTINEFFDRIENFSIPQRYTGRNNTNNNVAEADNVSTISNTEIVDTDSATPVKDSRIKTESHVNTKTGETQYKASVVPKADFKDLTNLARKNRGGYSRFTRSFLFDGEQNRDNFVKDVAAYLDSDNVKYSADASPSEVRLQKDEAEFSKIVDNFIAGKYPAQNPVPIKIMTTPLAMKVAGAELLPIYIDSSILAKTLTGRHGSEFNDKRIKKLPRVLAKPMAIFKSRTQEGNLIPNEFTVLVELTDLNDNPVVVPFVLNKRKERYMANVIKTIHGRTTNILLGKAIMNRDLLYLDTEKGLPKLRDMRLQLPNQITLKSFDTSTIPNETDLVKLQEENPEYYSSDVVPNNLGRVDAIPQDKLSAENKVTIEMGKELGAPVVFYKGKPSIRGFYKDGISHINLNGNRGAQWAFWHELVHRLKEMSPTTYNQFIEAIQAGENITDEQISEYRKTILNGETLSKESIIEEMLADTMPELAKRREVFDSLANLNPSLFKRFVKFIKDMFKTFREFVTKGNKNLAPNKTAGFTEAQVNAAEKVFDKLIGDIAKKNKVDMAAVKNNSDTKYSMFVTEEQNRWKSYGENLVTKVEEFVKGNISGRTIIKISDAPAILQELDDADYKLPNLPVSISALRAWQTMQVKDSGEHAHELTYEMLKQIPKAINEPVFMLKSDVKMKNGKIDKRIVVFTDIKDKNKKSILVPIVIAKDVTQKNLIATMYGRNNEDLFLAKQVVFENSLLYANTEKSPSWLQKTRLQLPRTVIKKSSLLENRIAEKNSFVKKGTPDIKYSADSSDTRSMVDRATTILAESLGLKAKPVENVTVRTKPATKTEAHFIRYYGGSPSEIAKRVPLFAPFFRLADKAMAKQERLRNKYNTVLQELATLLKDENDYEHARDILLYGDSIQKDFTSEELRERDVSEKAIKAYHKVRNSLKEIYELVNDARQQVKQHAKNMTDAQLKELKENKFAKILKIEDEQYDTETGQLTRLVHWKEPKTWTRTEEVTREAYELFEQDPDMQILDAVEKADGTMKVTYRESIKPVVNRDGYIPHFFHQFSVMEKTKDEDGQEVLVMADSGKTFGQAIEKANAIAAENPDKEYVVQRQGFHLDTLNEIAGIVGDNEFLRNIK